MSDVQHITFGGESWDSSLPYGLLVKTNIDRNYKLIVNEPNTAAKEKIIKSISIADPQGTIVAGITLYQQQKS